MSAAGGGKSGGSGPGQITDTRYRFPGERAYGEYIPPATPAYGNGGTTPWSPYANRQSTAAPVDQTQLYDNAPAPGFGPTPMPSPGMPGGKSGMIGNIGGRLGNDFGNFMETAIPGSGAPINNSINNLFNNRLPGNQPQPGQPLPPGVSKGFGLPPPQEELGNEDSGNEGYYPGDPYGGLAIPEARIGGTFGVDFGSPSDPGYNEARAEAGLPPEYNDSNPAPAKAPNQYTPSFAPGSTTPQGNAMNNINQPAWTQGRNVTKRPDGLWQDDKGYLLDNYTGSTVGTVRGHQGWLNKQAQFKARDAGMNPGASQPEPNYSAEYGGLA